MPTAPTTTIGTLARKIEFQAKLSSSQPPVIGPSTMPTPDTADQVAIALGRSCSSKRLVMIESVAGMMKAAAAPMSARVAISWPALPANDDATAPTPSMPSPINRTSGWTTGSR